MQMNPVLPPQDSEMNDHYPLSGEHGVRKAFMNLVLSRALV